jgi:hypothetical protein
MFTLSKEVKDLGINDHDVECMFKSIGKYPLAQVEITVPMLKLLLSKANQAEQGRKRSVALWLEVFGKLS